MRIARLLSVCLGTKQGRPTHAQHLTASIRECWLELVHPCTDLSQITVQLTIIEGSQFHPYYVCFSYHPSGQAKEREQPLPRRMSIGGGEGVITDPHRQIGQRDFAHRHESHLAVIHFVHRSLGSLQIFQRTADFSLLFDSYLLQFRIDDRFALFDLPAQQMISNSSHLQGG
jgi:hypothetical protein